MIMTQLTEPKRPYQEVGHALRQMITNMDYVIGDKLPPEREIAEMLDVSRAVVREALIMLELENLIEVRAKVPVFMLLPFLT